MEIYEIHENHKHDIDIDMLGAVRAWRAPTRAEKTAQQWASEVATYASDDLGVR